MANDSIFRDITPGLIWSGILVVLLGYAVLRLMRYLVDRITPQLQTRQRLTLMYAVTLFRVVWISLIALWEFSIFIDTSQQNLITLFGAIGIGLGFGLKDYVSNLLAGIFVLYEQPFKPGDWVEIAGHYGEVVAIGLFYTQLWRSDDTLIRIPQSVVWGSSIQNATSGDKELMCVIPLYLQPDHDMDLAISLMNLATKTSPFIEHHKQVIIVAKERPGYTEYSIKAYPIKSNLQFRFSTDVTFRIKQTLSAHGLPMVEFPLLNG